jgi:hypothetical protein
MKSMTIKQILISGTALLVLLGVVWVVYAHDTETPTPQPVAGTLDYVPTYDEHVRPILAANCTSCHVEGEFGHDSFEMDTDEEIIASAEDIALVVSTNYMPPWPPSELSPHFLYDRSLTNEDILQIVTWAEAGAPVDAVSSNDDNNGAVLPAEPLVEPDIVLTMPEPYIPNPERTDDYRCFLLDPNFTENTFVVGYDILPGNTGIVHHTVLFPGTTAQRAEADRLNGADGKPGWECFGGSGLSAGGPDMGMLRPLLPIFRAAGGIGELRILLQQPDAAAQLDALIAKVDTDGSLRTRINSVGGTQVLVTMLSRGLVSTPTTADQPITGVIGAWVPGSTPTQFPQDTGLLIPAGGFIILQMHYNTQANTEPDQSQLVLDIAAENDLGAVRVLDINAPVEIPCPEGVIGEACRREYAIARSGDGSDTLLAICGQSLEDYANQDPTNAVSTCNYRVPVSGWALAIMSHQHKLGVSTRTVLNPGTPNEQMLIDIPVWDFDWQGSYWFAEPIWLNEGDTINLTCVYDNSISRDNPEPVYIVAGEGTNDEMCLNFITMLPAEVGSPAPLMAGADADTVQSDHNSETATHDHSEPIHLTGTDAVPDVTLTVTEDADSGYLVRVQVTNFTFTPENAGGEHRSAEGHAHLYVDGEKVARIYDEYFYLASLPAGEHTITVTLNANTHAPLYVNDAPISDSVVVNVAE